MADNSRFKKRAIRALMVLRDVKYTTALREYEQREKDTDERTLNRDIMEEFHSKESADSQ